MLTLKLGVRRKKRGDGCTKPRRLLELTSKECRFLELVPTTGGLYVDGSTESWSRAGSRELAEELSRRRLIKWRLKRWELTDLGREALVAIPIERAERDRRIRERNLRENQSWEKEQRREEKRKLRRSRGFWVSRDFARLDGRMTLARQLLAGAGRTWVLSLLELGTAPIVRQIVHGKRLAWVSDTGDFL
jgi:hypothetical protein